MQIRDLFYVPASCYAITSIVPKLEESSKPIMEEISKVILTFKDQQYSLTKVMAKAGSGGIATIDAKEINVSDEALNMVQLSHICPSFHGGSISFFKLEGKYIVFGGRDQVLRDLANGKTQIAGHILSSPALKAARIVQYEAPAPAQVEALANKFNSSPSNRAEVRTPRKPYGGNPMATRNTSERTLHARSK